MTLVGRHGDDPSVVSLSRSLTFVGAVAAVVVTSTSAAVDGSSAPGITGTCSWSAIRVPVGTSASLSDVAVVAPDDVWMIGTRGSAAGARPVVLHYDGNRLRVVSVPLPPRRTNTLYDIGASAADDVWLSGRTDSPPSLRPLLLHWDGHRWRRLLAALNPKAPDASVFAVAAVGPSDAWLVGMQTPRPLAWREMIQHWNGQRWRIVPGPATFVAVTAIASDDVWAGGGGIGHWDGRAWRIAFTPNDFDPGAARVNAISASDPRNVWFGGEKPLVARFDGKEIREVPIPRALWPRRDSGFDPPALRTIAAFSPRDVWTAGAFGILHYDGSWHRASPITTVAAIDGLAADDLWAVGGSTRPVALHRRC
jgi:hypothetical protein